jgi:dGTPase
MIIDVLEETKRRIAIHKPSSPEDVRLCGEQLVSFSDEMLEKVDGLREFLWSHMYRHHRVRRMRVKVSRIVKDLYEAFMDQYELLPDKWQRKVELAGGQEDRIAKARVVADYIAGMTDRYAVREHENIFALYWGLK